MSSEQEEILKLDEKIAAWKKLQTVADLDELQLQIEAAEKKREALFRKTEQGSS